MYPSAPTWVLGIKLVLARQALYPMSRLPSAQVYNFIPFLYVKSKAFKTCPGMEKRWREVALQRLPLTDGHDIQDVGEEDVRLGRVQDLLQPLILHKV